MAYNDKPGGSLRSKRGALNVLSGALAAVKEEEQKSNPPAELPEVKEEEKEQTLAPSNLFTNGVLPGGDRGETVEDTLALQESADAQPSEPTAPKEDNSEPQEQSVQTKTPEPFQDPFKEPVEAPVEETTKQPIEQQASVTETLTPATEHVNPAPVETPLAPIPEQVIELEEVETSEPLAEVINQKPSDSDSDTFTRLKAATETASLDTSGSYAEMVESMISAQCQKSGVKNLDLSSFGMRAQGLNFPHLTVLEFGKHKFLGAPLIESERNKIVFQLGVHIAQSNKKRIVIKVVREVRDEHNMPLYSLLFDDLVAQQFANMFNYKVLINKDTADVSKLVMVVEKV